MWSFRVITRIAAEDLVPPSPQKVIPDEERWKTCVSFELLYVRSMTTTRISCQADDSPLHLTPCGCRRCDIDHPKIFIHWQTGERRSPNQGVAGKTNMRLYKDSWWPRGHSPAHILIFTICNTAATHSIQLTNTSPSARAVVNSAQRCHAR